MHNKVYHDFLTKRFSLTIPRSFVGSSCLSLKTSGVEKNFGEEWEVYHDLRAKFFVQEYRKIFVGRTLAFYYRSGREKG